MAYMDPARHPFLVEHPVAILCNLRGRLSALLSPGHAATARSPGERAGAEPRSQGGIFSLVCDGKGQEEGDSYSCKSAKGASDRDHLRDSCSQPDAAVAAAGGFDQAHLVQRGEVDVPCSAPGLGWRASRNARR